MSKEIDYSPERKEELAGGPALIIIRGLPGSGKTFLSKALVETLGNDNVKEVNPDEIFDASEEYQDFIGQLQREEPDLDSKFFPFRFLRKQALEAIQVDKIVIWDQPWSGLEKPEIVLETISKEIKAPVLLIEVELEAEKAMERLEKRKAEGGHGPNEEIFSQFVKKFRSINESDSCFIKIRGDTPIEKSVFDVLEQLKIVQQEFTATSVKIIQG